MDAYRQRIFSTHQALGIPKNYESNFGLPLIYEIHDLLRIEDDIFSRKQFIASPALKYWQAMRQAAAKDKVQLQLVSAFRSVDYQAGLIEKKLQKGISIDEILQVNAAPGYSEHHSGCALDLTTSGSQPLSEQFENTDAFAWLSQNAERYRFRLSYPKAASRKIIYEPWHWACIDILKER